MSEIPDGALSPSQSVTGQEPLDPPADSPVVFAHVIAEAIRDLMENHIHRYDILDVYKPPAPARIHPLMPAPVPVTIVLLRCQECVMPDTISLQGEWTLEQVTKEIGEEGEDGD